LPDNEETIVAELVEDAPKKPSPPNFSDRKTISALEYRTINNYVNGLKEGEDITMKQAAIQAGYAKSYAAQAASRINKLISQNEAVRMMMEKKGIGVETLVDDLKEIRGATCPPTKYDPNGEHPDYLVRQRNVEFRAQILDALPPKKLEIEERKISITITADTLERIRAVKSMAREVEKG